MVLRLGEPGGMQWGLRVFLSLSLCRVFHYANFLTGLSLPLVLVTGLRTHTYNLFDDGAAEKEAKFKLRKKKKNRLTDQWQHVWFTCDMGSWLPVKNAAWAAQTASLMWRRIWKKKRVHRGMKYTKRFVSITRTPTHRRKYSKVYPTMTPHFRMLYLSWRHVPKVYFFFKWKERRPKTHDDD